MAGTARLKMPIDFTRFRREIDLPFIYALFTLFLVTLSLARKIGEGLLLN